jgi:ABC-2 type transport system ATP-binding protein
MVSMSARPAVSVDGLRKSFGGKRTAKTVLDGIDLEVAEGTTFALLGPNGAGKTTAVQILSTLIGFDRGEVRIAGHDLATEADAVRGAIGVTGQFSAVDDLLTGAENLQLMADLRRLGRVEGRRRAGELLDQFDLGEAAGRLASTYSGGMRRRLDLAMTLIGRPRVIFLDEPTTGLDPRSRRLMWQIVRDLVADGVTIFLTTQYLEEADKLADHIAVLDKGKIVAAGTPAELKRSIPGGHVRFRFSGTAALDTAARALSQNTDPTADRDGDSARSTNAKSTQSAHADLTRDDEALTLQVPSDGGVRTLQKLLEQLDQAGAEVDEVELHTPDLDDVFLALTNRPVAGSEVAR